MVRTSFITMSSMVGIVGRAGCRWKCDVVFYLFVTLSNDEVCDNGNAL